jgi:hypothetical protein
MVGNFEEEEDFSNVSWTSKLVRRTISLDTISIFSPGSSLKGIYY